MNITEIIIGSRVLVQTGAEQKEHAKVRAVLDNGKVLVHLSDYRLCEIEPQFILKTFES